MCDKVRGIKEVENDGRALWKALNSILSPQSPLGCPLSPDELLDHFARKTVAIRKSTNDAPSPDKNSNHMNFSGFCAFEEVTLPEVDKLLRPTESNTKHCELVSSLSLVNKIPSLCLCLHPSPAHKLLAIHV